MAARVRTYVDASVVIAAFRAEEASHRRAMAILDDPARAFVACKALSLELLPSPRAHGLAEQAAAYELFLESVEEWLEITDDLFDQAIETGSTVKGLRAMDALHAVAARALGATFVTLEKREKPFGRVRGLDAEFIE